MISIGGESQRQKAVSMPARVGMWAPGQEAVFATLWPLIQQGLAGPSPRYPGELYVERTPEEEEYFKQVRTGALQTLLSGKPPYEVGPEFAEKYFEESVRPIAMREYEEITKPTITEAYAGPGYWGSARAGAETRGAEKFAEELASAKAGLMYGEELRAREAEEAALGRVLPAYETLGTAGQYARMIEQERVLGDLQRWLMGEEMEGVYAPWANPFLQLAFQVLGLDPYALAEMYRATGKGTGWNLGILSSYAGGKIGG